MRFKKSTTSVNLDKMTLTLWEQDKISLEECFRQIAEHNNYEGEMPENFEQYLSGLGWRNVNGIYKTLS